MRSKEQELPLPCSQRQSLGCFAFPRDAVQKPKEKSTRVSPLTVNVNKDRAEQCVEPTEVMRRTIWR